MEREDVQKHSAVRTPAQLITLRDNHLATVVRLQERGEHPVMTEAYIEASFEIAIQIARLNELLSNLSLNVKWKTIS